MSSKSILQKDLEDAADFNLTLEEKVYKSNKISLELMAQVKQMKLSMDYMAGYARVGGVYEPFNKDDVIDFNLAEYINWSPYRQPLSQLFVRESEGVYQFGSKRTTIKYENTELKVRVGGGFLSIDEFVQQYLPLEVEKLGPLGLYNVSNPLAAYSVSQLNANALANRSLSPKRKFSPNRSMNNIRQSVSI